MLQLIIMKQKIEKIIKQSVDSNSYWREPLISYAKADNPRFYELKESVRSTHALPKDLMKDAVTVIAFFIPFKKEYGEQNHQPGDASYIWSKMYVETNKLIKDISLTIKNFLKTKKMIL